MRHGKSKTCKLTFTSLDFDTLFLLFDYILGFDRGRYIKSIFNLNSIHGVLFEFRHIVLILVVGVVVCIGDQLVRF